eukprot:CAMPEP_0114625148 /NCGR_PEP_ID=MMETSP0168-20121206/11124_1 /TAXON_ID=95228 ORGANISM="Vannella sp., Strain DIVA3 517/6/12" /NCGR_SAMPLE_ID=MMETSP0168 /ASSEMBLY_ACC=CAM_ASM_000044 /LENGTH=56 /DNA_ID=CAMNT_0001836427 /DNA_START=384 /DNA_END=551 /DNA_ORIENTATION=+
MTFPLTLHLRPELRGTSESLQAKKKPGNGDSTILEPDGEPGSSSGEAAGSFFRAFF